MSDATSQTVYFYNRHPISCEIILAKLRASRGHLDGLRPEELFPTTKIIMAASPLQMSWREKRRLATDRA
ncbi:MAG: hypothetical protein E5Y18_04395 [Mesorhizobium sp.]|uniref:hypothetical protein n=1 Tax=Mesorhizobium sp. TaxID=1871066 RepID=UPI0011FC580D|nr:hypothetical protein [Mesorhizobium sp.]TIN76931.1 MAG: hypothetical protein E5Y09_19550 [Mesorhizobium sp.]TJV58416.1 MAG: hypothetical protein E5Y18_04395 [Mesorhizobium sp.]